MFKLVLVALMAGILCLVGGQCAPTKVQRPENAPSKKESTAKRSSIVVSDRNPTGAFALEADLPKAETDVLEVTVSRVVNPSMTAVNVSVYFAAEKSQSQSNSEKVLVGSFTLYPPDRPGKFLLYDVTMVLGSPFFNSGLLHCPIHGPHAFASTFAPISLSDCI